MSSSNISLIISLISIGISMYNFYREMRRLKIEINNIRITEDKYTNIVIVRCIISNHSKNQITISSIDLIADNVINVALAESIFISEINVEVFNQKASWTDNSITLPLKLDSYDNLETAIVFPVKKNSNISNKSKIIFKTSRGKKKITLKNKLLNK